MNNKYEFISYKAYPDDMYTKAIAKVRIDGKHVVAFAQKQMKDGSAFWSNASIQVNDGGEKRYIQGYMIDSRSEEEMLLEFVKDNVKRVNSGTVQMSASAFQGAPQVQHGVTDNEPLPF